MTSPASNDRRFDAAQYWRERHRRLPGLGATGTLGPPLRWQHWLYRGKLRAYLRAYRAAGFTLNGRSVLDFGCGTGHFEDVWESLGAIHTAGIDLVEDVIRDLQVRYPHRTYLSGNLARDDALIARLGQFDLVTAIDVLYHIVDDGELERVVSGLARCLSVHGCLLFTDSLADHRPAAHVRFRSKQYWERLLSKHQLRIAHCEPVFVSQNRPSRLVRLAPSLAGAMAYWADSALTKLAPSLANNFAVLCRGKQAGLAE